MRTVTVWLAYTTTNEYGAIGSCLGVFLSQFFAEQAAEGKGWWGGTGTVLKRKAIVENGEVYVLEGVGEPQRFADESAESDLRQKAMAKLSPAERKALGL